MRYIPKSVMHLVRGGGCITSIDIYEHAGVEFIDCLRIKILPATIAHTLRLDLNGNIFVRRINLEERTAVLLPWYDEKYVCTYVEEFIDKLEEIHASPAFTTWMASRV